VTASAPVVLLAHFTGMAREVAVALHMGLGLGLGYQVGIWLGSTPYSGGNFLATPTLRI
jgi:hypothetical protein